MKTITTYMADDGTIFDNYEDCEAYEFEQNLKSVKDNLKMWSDTWEPINEEINTTNYDNILGSCAYIFLGNETAVRVADKIGYEYGYSMPKKVGYWYYDYEEGTWICLNEKIIKLRKELSICESEFKMMGGEL